ncbi:twin-arginine translocation signal domain-containing protein [Anatilimnocola floriformis]|uniref:twin-arginine translocation signal domain-containing protein n=1 Tax=Anatilimnocola floriformis TaxID=2948575 RepID=UPI0020C52400|nr:twin-arginine translocation signal domain-containing protein [Anatilimnocola floriformis]
MMQSLTRRTFLQGSTAALAAGALGGVALDEVAAQIPGQRPDRPEGITVLNPQGRVPMSFIIDDSTCLVNLAHFCIPQFAEVFPDKYLQDWRKLPRGIPDSFVREFGEWCHEHGVKGKYSIVPYPATVGWIDREMPGWSKKELQDSLKLVRDLMVPDWDIHPEMITHTWAINTETGRPYEQRNENFMENWGFSAGKSVDEVANYMAYALKILKNAGLSCEGITTPGGFGNKVLPNLSQATLQACRDVFQAEIPHYFRHLYDKGDRSVAPRVEYAAGLESNDPKCVVSIIGCTGDWFGGWDGLTPGNANQCISADGTGGRLPEVIDRGEPAIMVCHWPGIYFNGEKIGFNILKEIVARLDAKYSKNELIWMKLSEISRYWAAKELTKIELAGDRVKLQAPFSTPNFTIEIAAKSPATGAVKLKHKEQLTELKAVAERSALKSGTSHQSAENLTVCFDLPKGMSELML